MALPGSFNAPRNGLDDPRTIRKAGGPKGQGARVGACRLTGNTVIFNVYVVRAGDVGDAVNAINVIINGLPQKQK